MTGATLAPARRAPARVPFWRSRTLVLIAGVVVAPIALTLAFNSWGPLTEESAIRMAFATVAGQTLAIFSAVLAFVLTVVRRSSWPQIVFFLVVAVLVVGWASGALESAADLLQSRFGRIAEVDILGR
jgi:drug/metabolite transporter (DMT)-like permease